MSDRQSPLFWSFPLGTLFATQVRISVFFPLILGVLCFKLGLQLGLIFSLLLFVSVLFHEFGHVVAARFSGGMADEILLWPLGGLAFVQPAGSTFSRLIVPAAGPLVNLMVCVITLPAVYASPFVSSLNPLVLPIAELTDGELFRDVLLLIFAANWLMFLVNLIPVYPLDGGQVLQAALYWRLGGEIGSQVFLRVGFLCAFVMMLTGVVVDATWLVFIGAAVLVLNMYESYQIHSGESYDDSFMGYDFSQGYTSLERSTPSRPEPAPGLLERWRTSRKARRDLRDLQKRQQAEEQLDALLEKVHQQGFNSLTEWEKRVLARASERYREKGERPEA